MCVCVCVGVGGGGAGRGWVETKHSSVRGVMDIFWNDTLKRE